MPALGIRLQTSESGEVLAQGNVVLAGYWENPDASAEALDGGWFHTGDGGTIDDGGYLTISDRKKDVIITGGENVSSIEVEDAVFSHPAVAEVAVIGVPDDKWGEMVTALVVVAEGEQVTEEEIIAHCRGRIAGYKIPKRVEFRDELAAHRHRQDPEVQAARVVLEGLGAPGQLTGPAAPTARRLAVALQRGHSPARVRRPSTPLPVPSDLPHSGALPGAVCVERCALRGRAALEVGTWTALPGAPRCSPCAWRGRRSPSPSRSG